MSRLFYTIDSVWINGERSSIMEARFVKIGNTYINVINIERLVVDEDGIYLYVLGGGNYKVTEKPVKDGAFAMKRIVRKINEKAYDIICLEEFVENDEAFRE